MRGVLPLLITTALAVAPLLSAPPTIAAAPAHAVQASSSVSAKKKTPKKNDKKAAKTRGIGHLRVIITGSPKGRVQVKGPGTHLSVIESSVLRVRSGRYRVHAANVSADGNTYVPASRRWNLRIRKGDTTMLAVTYARAGSSAPGSVDGDTPPAGMLAEVFTLVNQARSEQRTCGDKVMPAVDPVVYDAELGQAAQGHAEDMNVKSYFDHDSLDGRSFADRIQATRYAGSPGGENIAMGHQAAAEVMDGWLKSPGHCLNIMEAEFDELGLGFASHADARYSIPVTYWVQDFGYAPDYL